MVPFTAVNLNSVVVALTQRGKKHLHLWVSRHCACVRCPSFEHASLLRFMSCCVLLYQAERHIVACHLVGRWCGMPQGCVLGANAWFVTKYDSKGDGLMRLAGHT